MTRVYRLAKALILKPSMYMRMVKKILISAIVILQITMVITFPPVAMSQSFYVYLTFITHS